jgi:hypothetical protein
LVNKLVSTFLFNGGTEPLCVGKTARVNVFETPRSIIY